MRHAMQRNNQNPDSVLSNNINESLQTMVRLSRQLIDFANQESQCLITNDLLRFGYLQKDKNALATRYAKASEEFRSRLDDFRKSDKALLMQLDRLQAELKEKTQGNNIMIEQIKTRASANTQSTLFTVQEMGQRISMPQEQEKRA